jgi:hypothetical protein
LAGGGGPVLGKQLAFFEVHDPAGAPGRVGIVRDHHDGLAELRVEPLHQPEHLLGRAAVEVARGLVGHEDRRVADDGARDRHTLLLAPGKLGRVVRQAIREPDHRQRRRRPLPPLGRRQGREQQRQLHVLERRQHRHQVVELEDEADVPRPPRRKLGFRERGDVRAGHLQRPPRRLVDAGDEVEQGGLAGARRAHQRDEVARGDLEIDVLEHGHDLRAAPVSLRHTRDAHDGSAHAPPRPPAAL